MRHFFHDMNLGAFALKMTFSILSIGRIRNARLIYIKRDELEFGVLRAIVNLCWFEEGKGLTEYIVPMAGLFAVLLALHLASSQLLIEGIQSLAGIVPLLHPDEPIVHIPVFISFLMSTEIIVNVFEAVAGVEGFYEELVVVLAELGFGDFGRGAVVDGVGQALWLFQLGNCGGFGGVVGTPQEIGRGMFRGLFFHTTFGQFRHILPQNSLVIRPSFLQELCKHIILDFQMLLTGQHMPLINHQMIIIKEPELGQEFIFIIQQQIKHIFLLGQKLPGTEPADFVPDCFIEYTREGLFQGDGFVEG